MRSLLPLALLLIPGAASAQRVELPVREVDLSDGARRYGVTLRIDGQTVEAGLDTGSTGLRVLPRGLGAGGGAANGAPVDYSYGAGTAFSGAAIRVPVGAGAVSGTIRIMRIDRIGCRSDKRDCPAAGADPARFGIQGDGLPGEGFAAILGIRLLHDTVDNPFLQLGARRWIVELPRPGERTGRIVLNPSDAEVAAYRRIAIDDRGTTAGCLVGPAALGKLCGRAFFDSGAPGLRILSDARVTPWPNGTPATIAVGDGAALATMPVEIGRRDQASAMFYAPTPGATPPRLSLGLAPYFHWSVLYDADRHQIGLAPR